MSGVQGIRSAPKLAAGGSRPASRGEAFSVPADAAAAAPTSVSAVSLAGLLALQEAGGDAVQDREARRHGHDLLSELAALQRDLLDGAPDPARLERLAALVTTGPIAADPRLREIVGAISLRVRIETARYGLG